MSKVFTAIFGSATVPIISPIPVVASLSTYGQWDKASIKRVYLLDLDAITADQRHRLIYHLAKKFNTRPGLINASISRDGVPIIAENVTVTITDVGVLL